jgi:hypothetical protein
MSKVMDNRSGSGKWLLLGRLCVEKFGREKTDVPRAKRGTIQFVWFPMQC